MHSRSSLTRSPRKSARRQSRLRRSGRRPPRWRRRSQPSLQNWTSRVPCCRTGQPWTRPINPIPKFAYFWIGFFHWDACINRFAFPASRIPPFFKTKRRQSIAEKRPSNWYRFAISRKLSRFDTNSQENRDKIHTKRSFFRSIPFCTILTSWFDLPTTSGSMIERS